MGKILDSVRMSEPVSPPSSGEPGHRPRKPPLLEDARIAVIAFLEKAVAAKQVDVTKLAQIDTEEGTWEAEAEVYVPNPTIRALGLPVQKEVLDCQLYLLRLDGQLNIVAYGLRDSVENKED